MITRLLTAGSIEKEIDTDMHRLIQRELKQMEPILNFHVPAEGLELVILLHTEY